jgi:AraC-like DNA-binding protein
MPQNVRFTDIAPEARILSLPDNPDFTQVVIENKYWGKVEENIFSGDHFVFKEHRASLKEHFNVMYDEYQMPQSVNVCMSLQGDLSLNIRQSGFRAGLLTGQHHAVYSDETEYDILVGSDVHIVRLMIDLSYYADLLCDQTRWTGMLKEKLLKKELAFSGSGHLELEMRQVIRTIVNNPMRGNLKKLLIEAKILELLALQIGQLSDQDKKNDVLKSRDVDTFHALRAHLDTHFADDLSLKQLSRTFGLNEFKLKKGFKELFQSTVFDYIHECRMAHARRLLLDEKKYVNEVSGLVGYKNPNHFSTAFKKKFGQRPGDLK